MIRKAKFIKPNDIRFYFRHEHPEARVSVGFLKLLDLHMEAVLKRAAAQTAGRNYLDATAALIACRYPFHIVSSRMEYQP